MTPDKNAMAKSGFVYTGRGDKCFMCGVGLKHWERTDDVWKEHYKWSPNCDFLKMVGWNDEVPVKPRRFGEAATTKPVEGFRFGTSYDTTSSGPNTKS